MSSLTQEFKKGMSTMLRSHHITEVLMLSETKEHSGKEAGHSICQHLPEHKGSGRRLRKTVRLNPR